jgi:putative glutamine amidotransferase
MPDPKPVIGVSKCSKNDDYIESVRRAGGEPLLLDWEVMSVADALARIDALVLTGGPDVDPSRYAAAAHPSTQPAHAARDRFELELASAAVAQDRPVLGICRGMQVLNVAAGGTLVQDIPTGVSNALPHDIKDPKNAVAHTVALQPGTLVSRLLGTSEAKVNSRHHQAVQAPGKGWSVTAVSRDGIVEAIERSGARFCLGVEWHPENFVETGEFLPLFRGLVEAARK